MENQLNYANSLARSSGGDDLSRKLGLKCDNETQRMCNDGNSCYYKTERCDRWINCLDNSDELGCSCVEYLDPGILKLKLFSSFFLCWSSFGGHLFWPASMVYTSIILHIANYKLSAGPRRAAFMYCFNSCHFACGYSSGFCRFDAGSGKVLWQ